MTDKKLCLMGIVFTLTSISYSQTGKVTVRKTQHNLVGKTLLLQDCRGFRSGNIFFKDDGVCIIKIRLEVKKNPFNETVLNSIQLNRNTASNYQLINDTLLILFHDNFSDTCYYQYINQNTNLVKLNNTILGELKDGDYSIFFDVDSLLFSTSYNKVISNINFSDSLLLIDSLYKDIKDPKRRKQLEKDFISRVKNYKNNQEINFYKGGYRRAKNQITLLNDLNEPFATVDVLNKKTAFTQLSTSQPLENSLVLTSEYSRYHYGKQINRYDKAILQYYHPDNYILVDDIEKPIPIMLDTFNIYYTNRYTFKLKKGTDSTFVMLLEDIGAKFKNRVGGYYKTRLLSKNGNSIPYKNLYFAGNKAFKLDDSLHFNEAYSYNYLFTDSILAIFIGKDTLIDELENSWHSFSFSYKNQQPYVFGIYHYNNRVKEHHQFIILFSDFTGISYQTKNFNYKEARAILQNKTIVPSNSTSLKNFKYESSGIDLWLTYQSGDYKKMEFYNHHKGIKNDEKAFVFIK